MLWLISNTNTPGAEAARDALREEHRRYLRDHSHALVLSGPLQSDDGSSNWGSIFLVSFATAEEARAFSAAEPFTRAGLYDRTTISRVRKGNWNPAAADAGV